MISNFEELVAPLRVPEFLNLLRERKLTFCPGIGGERYSDILDREKLLALIDAGTCNAERLRVTFKQQLLNASFYREKDKISVDKLRKILDRGASIIMVPLDPYVPGLGGLCADIQSYIHEDINAGAILTCGDGGALQFHHDEYDLVILQAQGSKRWRIYGSPAVNPIKGFMKSPPPKTEPIFDQTLNPGDFLFVPAGYWHHCENGPGNSLHIGIFFMPPTGWYAFEALLKIMLQEEMIRAPLTRFINPADSAAHEAAVKSRLIKMVETIPLAQMVAQAKSLPERLYLYDKFDALSVGRGHPGRSQV